MVETIYDILGEILRDIKIINEAQSVRNLVLLGRGGVMDSLTAMRLIGAVEQRFNVDIVSDLNLDCLETTDTLAAFIARRTPEPILVGRHLVIDCENCPVPILNDLNAVQELVHTIADAIGTLVLKEDYHAFSPAGVTGCAIVSASHIAVHTWPEYGYLGVDVFSCRDIQAETVIEAIIKNSGDTGDMVCRYHLLDRVAGQGKKGGFYA